MDDLKTLCEGWLLAKTREQAAGGVRLELETEILKLIETPTEGSRTIPVDGFKLVVSQPIYRKIDPEIWNNVAGQIPDELQPAKVVPVLKIDDEGCRWLATNRPDLWQVCSKAITEKPGKPGVKIERKEKKDV